MDKEVLIKQSQHWENNFSSKPEMFGLDPSFAAINAIKIFKENSIQRILELGNYSSLHTYVNQGHNPYTNMNFEVDFSSSFLL